MESSFESISIIKEENNEKNNEYNNYQLKIMNKEDELNFDKALELSEIDILDEQIEHKNKNDEDNIKEENDLSDYSFIKDTNIIKNKKNSGVKKINSKKPKNKITKEELNNIPLPIFSCIYCCDEHISFKHLSNEIISNKYLYQTSIYDMKQLEFLISGKSSKKITDNKLLNIVINNYENLKDVFSVKKINNYFKSKKFGIKCEKNEMIIRKRFRMKLEEKVNKKKKDFYFKEIKGMYKISKNSLNNKCLFNTNSIINNCSSLAGLIPTNSELIQNLTEKNNNSLSNNNLINMNKQVNSMNKNEIGLIVKDNNKHYVENIIEKIDKNLESDIFEFLGENDLKRKINKKDIEWEDTYYDINKPIINDDEININNEEDKILELINNKKNKNRNKSNINIKKNNLDINNNNNSKHISINSENKSHLKISIFNNSKSLASTNTSSNIILKDKENKTLSIFLNKNKIFNIENNSMLSPRYQNIIFKDIRKSRKNMKEKNLSPSFTKTKEDNYETKSFKKLFGNGNSCIDLKNIHKKILFNHTVNIKKEMTGITNIKNNRINFDLKPSKNHKNIFNYDIDKEKEKEKICISKENMTNKSYNKYKLLLNGNKNRESNSTNSSSFLDKMIKRFKSNKDDNKKHSIFNSVFKFRDNLDKFHVKSPINNIKYSLIISHKNRKEKLKAINFNKNDLKIKNLESEYINNFISTNINNENNIFEKKFITESNNNENIKNNKKIKYMKKEIKIIS